MAADIDDGEQRMRLMYAALAGAAGIVGVAWMMTAIAQRLYADQEDRDASSIHDADMRYCYVHGHHVAFREHGTGSPAVVLLHGFGGNAHIWDAILPGIAARSRVVAIDLLGFGSSDRPDDLTPYHWPEQICGVLDHLGIAEAVLLGHSLGGRAAIITAAMRPERVCGLCVLNSDGIEIPQLWPVYRLLSDARVTSLLLRFFQHNQHVLNRIVQTSYHSMDAVTFDVVAEFQRQVRVRGTLASWSHLGRSYAGNQLEPLSAQVHCPTWIIWGAQDVITPISCAYRLQRTIPHADIVLLPDIGHVPQIEAPELVLAHVRAFIDSLSTVSRR